MEGSFMEELIRSVEDGNRQEVEKSLQTIISREETTEQQLIEILNLFPKLVERFQTPRIIDHKGTTITWYSYESLIWAIGEMFRQKLLGYKKLRRSESLFIPIEKICLNRSFGKGRESFTMLLGIYGGSGRIPTLLTLLDDKEVQGQVIYALRLLKAIEAKEKVKPFLESRITWIRNEAKKYFEKISG